MRKNDQPKRDLISTLATVGTVAFIAVFLIGLSWRRAAGLIAVVALVAGFFIALLWFFPPAIDDEEHTGKETKSN
jgi:Na+/proline symporter